MKIRSYLAKGLSSYEIGRLVGLSASTVRERIASARKNGLLPPKSAQKNLPGVM